ncbi:unnamed protein product, partial [Cladocopium goreaui]
RQLCTQLALNALRSLQQESSRDFSLACAAYASLEEVYGMDMSDIDLMVHFQEEPLLLIPSMAEAKPKVLKKKNWRRSVDCMWYDVPRADEVGCASLEGLLPGHLEDFCIEVLGVPALQADEVAARLDILRRTQSQIDER